MDLACVALTTACERWIPEGRPIKEPALSLTWGQTWAEKLFIVRIRDTGKTQESLTMFAMITARARMNAQMRMAHGKPTFPISCSTAIGKIVPLMLEPMARMANAWERFFKTGGGVSQPTHDEAVCCHVHQWETIAGELPKIKPAKICTCVNMLTW